VERRFGFSGRQVQNAQRVVGRAGDHVATIGNHCHGIDPVGMALERRVSFPRRRVPDAQGVVPVAGDHVAAVGCDCHGKDRVPRALFWFPP
jgi:hypothetical protein